MKFITVRGAGGDDQSQQDRADEVLFGSNRRQASVKAVFIEQVPDRVESWIVAAPGRGFGEGAGGGSLRFRRGKPSRPEPRPHANAKMLGLAPLGFGDIGKVAGGLATRRAVTTIATEDAVVRDVERLALIEKQSFRNDVIELDHLAGDIEPATLAEDLTSARHRA